MQGFKLPLEKLKNEPIKKTYDYYKTNDNLWNSKYLSSPKIAKYYLDPQELYLTGPLCPFNLSVIDSTERSQAAHDKATKNKLNSRQMLIERKKERETVRK